MMDIFPERPQTQNHDAVILGKMSRTITSQVRCPHSLDMASDVGDTLIGKQ